MDLAGAYPVLLRRQPSRPLRYYFRILHLCLVTHREKADPNDYHLIIIYYFTRSSVYELNVAIPMQKRVVVFVTENINIQCQGDSLDKFLAAKFDGLSAEERKICSKVARLCATGKIRSLHPINNPYNRESYIAEMEVGSVKDWAENRARPYSGEMSIFTKELDDGVIVRLCEGRLERW
jgi:hypothetical protein